MKNATMLTTILFVLFLLVLGATIVRILLRPQREPASRVAWLTIILALPGLGIIAYLLLGETSIGKRRIAKMREVLAKLPNVADTSGVEVGAVPEEYMQVANTAKTVNGLDPVGGNCGRLLDHSNAAIDAIVADIDGANHHVHILFYIWLTDNNGLKVAEALKRAAARGVICRAMADDLGSRAIIASGHWKAMEEAGVRLGVALPIGNPLLRPLRGRIDLRNHRKTVVIDNRITYCGSQNCADPEFRVKPKYAPWVDEQIRFEGSIARQNQFLFASDWEAATGENMGCLLEEPFEKTISGFPAQVIGTGPTVRYSAMPDIFKTLIFAARKELIITTPYYVPDDGIQAALCLSARRGVDTKIIFPARNDSWVVAAASHSYYRDLLAAGVQIYEYEGGLLHTKSLTIDGKVTLIGSANMDRRSFELNYENNIIFYDAKLTSDMRARQQSYFTNSKAVGIEMVEGWSWQRRLWNNVIAMLGPIL